MYYNKGNIQIVDCGLGTEMVHTTDSTLEELGAGEKPTIYVFNKCDKLEIVPSFEQLKERGTVCISAKDGFGVDNLDDKASERTLIKALQRTFPPEFVNRLDDIIVFHALNDEALAQILWLELRPLQVRLEAMGYSLELSDETQQEILRLARDKQYGARPLKRAIQTLIEDPLTDKLLAGEIENKIIKI